MKRILVLLAFFSSFSLFPADPAAAIAIPTTIIFPAYQNPETGVLINFPSPSFIDYEVSLGSPVQTIINNAQADAQAARTEYNNALPAIAIPQINYFHIDITLAVTDTNTGEQHGTIVWLDSRYEHDPAVTLAEELVQVLPDNLAANSIVKIDIQSVFN